MVTVAQVERAFAETLELHQPVTSPGVGAWDYHCPECGAGAMVLRLCDTCGEAEVEEVTG